MLSAHVLSVWLEKCFHRPEQRGTMALCTYIFHQACSPWTFVCQIGLLSGWSPSSSRHPVLSLVERRFPLCRARVRMSCQADIIGPGDSWKWSLCCSSSRVGSWPQQMIEGERVQTSRVGVGEAQLRSCEFVWFRGGTWLSWRHRHGQS